MECAGIQARLPEIHLHWSERCLFLQADRVFHHFRVSRQISPMRSVPVSVEELQEVRSSLRKIPITTDVMLDLRRDDVASIPQGINFDELCSLCSLFKWKRHSQNTKIREF